MTPHEAILPHFLRDVQAVHRTSGGTKETSYYTAINNLMDAVGDGLKPKVRAVMQLKNLGAGNPDGGLFTADQFDKRSAEVANLGAPARGVIEVKSPGEAVDGTATSAQVDKYWARYKLVLVTNLRDWLLLGERLGERVALERFTLAASEEAFWQLRGTGAQSVAFADFLARVLTHQAPLAEPSDLAALLASYAREARFRVECANADPAGQAARQLAALQENLEDALGVHFDALEGAHFFRSTLVQTLFYGMFSAWVLQRQDGEWRRPFDWRSAQYSLNVPMLTALFAQLSQPQKLRVLNLEEVLDWAADALRRVDGATFFRRFESGDAIQYFYEPFLAAFDPVLRKRLGVWYTPHEIVRYQVERVDQVLRSELGLAAGLADESVVVLDPCCGTGAYLVEVLRLIAARLGAGALAAHQLKAAAMQRLFGFELLPAPYVVAHLQLGLLLRQFGAPLEGEERAGIYLTNALTGWEPPKPPKSGTPFLYPEFEDERDAADAVKRTQKIIVILGNPPYDAFNGVAVGEEQNLVAPYKEGLIQTWGIKKFNLDDLYVRFFRLAERRIAEVLPGQAEGEAKRGVVSFISNFSWSTEPSFVVMREHLLRNFDKFWLENMHGNRNISEYAPDGRTSETVFAQKGMSPGIRQGVVISTWVKTGKPSEAKEVWYADGFNHAKADERRQALLQSLQNPKREAAYQRAQPSQANKYSFKPSEVGADYLSWPQATELAEKMPWNGPIERRGNTLIALKNDAQGLNKIADYLNPEITNTQLADAHPVWMKDSGEFQAARSRRNILERQPRFDSSRVVTYPFKPFDVRVAYLDNNIAPLFSRPSPELLKLSKTPGIRFFVTRDSADKKPEGFPFLMSNMACDYDCLSGHARHFPTLIATQASHLLGTASTTRANLSPLARAYLQGLGLPDHDSDRDTAEAIWLHALAIGYSPAYLAENADGIRQDWPRIPLPQGRETFIASVALGREVAALLDTENPVPGVTAGVLRSDIATVAVVLREGGGALKTEEFALTAGWGSQGKEGVTMPGKGRTRKSRERNPQASDDARDIFLNDCAFWADVPEAVWGFTIGGYQVMKKWLSYREHRVLGRALTIAEIEEVSHMARRLAALVKLQPQLDHNYRSCST